MQQQVSVLEHPHQHSHREPLIPKALASDGQG